MELNNKTEVSDSITKTEVSDSTTKTEVSDYIKDKGNIEVELFRLI